MTRRAAYTWREAYTRYRTGFDRESSIYKEKGIHWIVHRL